MTEHWGNPLADTLRDISRRLARLADAVDADWPVQRGQEWAARAAQLHRELSRQADAAADPAASAEPTGPATGWAAGSPSGRSRIRLGGMDARRADREPGIRIAELPPP